ncbi:MAG TPA: hypothetical protein VGQ44_16550 [Gemmatimonadaceae bacterium]|nr:hypothetical protein [Gemmatimonadaceae bacterium]
MSDVAPGNSSSRTSGSLQRRVTAAFTQQLGLKGMAVLVSVVLWFVVNAKEPQIALVAVRFSPQLDSSLVLRDPVPNLQALVAGSPKELIKLTSNPPAIRRPIGADSPDTVVVDLRPDDVTLPDGVDAVVRDVEPRSITLRFESTASRRVPIVSALSVNATGVVGPIATRFDPESVQVSGPRQRVAQVRAVQTIKAVITFPDSVPHLVDVDTTGFGTLRVKPSQVKVLIVGPMPIPPVVPATPHK